MAQEWPETTFTIYGTDEQILNAINVLRNSLTKSDIFHSFFIKIKPSLFKQRILGMKPQERNLCELKPREILKQVRNGAIRIFGNGPYNTWKTYTDF